MENNIDPCVFMKQEGMKFCVLCIYVNDGILTGDLEMMQDTLEGLFKVKVDKSIKDFLGCEISKKDN